MKKNKNVVPFTKLTEYLSWVDKNCHNCAKYESESQTEEQAGCLLAYHLDLGTLTGEIPICVAQQIGCTFNASERSCELHANCSEYEEH